MYFADLTDALGAYAQIYPNRIGARDLDREMTFASWHRRSRRLANGLIGLGLRKGDRVCVLAYNAIEWLEIYIATAMAGLIAVPINFRLVGDEIAYIAGDCECRAFIVQFELLEAVAAIRSSLPCPTDNYIVFGGKRKIAGFRDYEAFMAQASEAMPEVRRSLTDPWTMMYTSGTTGRPKGAMRSHAGSATLALVTDAEMGFTKADNGLLVMPLCHANSLYFVGAFLYCAAACTVFNRRSFDPEELLATLSTGGGTFTSLVPTHYTLMLDLPERVRSRYDVSRVGRLMISSAPARRDTKLAIMDYFRGAGLYEMYGSTETGWATMLHPEDQLSKLGSVGRELIGSRRIKLLDKSGNEVPTGEPGELYSCNPYTFDGYWRLPEKTQEAFREDYCSVGDFARRDDEGFIYLVDRKSNMIISGGENVYPAEIEAVLGQHQAVQDVAIIGLFDEKWGERVHAVIVPRQGERLTTEQVILCCREKLAGYKVPKSVSFIAEEEMPRTATGKIMHRLLRSRFQ